MKSRFLIGLISLFTGFLITSCCTCHKGGRTASKSEIPGPQVIIYKMKGDFSNLVPVTLSDDKKSVISYPGPKDVYTNGKLAKPTRLSKDFWLDNRGISANTAFLRLTYEEYAVLDKMPSPEELMGMVAEKNPISRMYACGLRSSYSNIEEELNKAIEAGDFSKFTKLK